MEPDYTALAGPAFMLLIGLELWLARRRGEHPYRLNDAISDVGTGILMQLTLLLVRALVLAGYVAVYAKLRLLELSVESAGTWIACFLAVDFAYYWFHRLSHEVNFLWAAHVVHHQSEDFNLAVALRQSTLQPIFASVFYWPLALLGFPPLVFLACAAVNTLYQFWLHTQLIGRLGPLEAVLVTPSHHRVHHGRNPVYIDRNHGGTFIVWDRLFGTFEREGEKVVYGITTPLASWNPVWANLHYWIELFRTARATRRPLDKVRTFLARPGWFPADRGGPQEPPAVDEHTPIFDRPYPRELAPYALLHFALLVALTIALGFFEGSVGLETKALAIALVVWGILNLGGLFEGRAWAFRSEVLRVVASPLLPLALLGGAEAWVLSAAFALGAPLALRLTRVQPFFRSASAA